MINHILLADLPPTAATTKPAAPEGQAGEVRRVAAALEHGSEHPIARAVATAAPREEHPEVSGFANREGLGVVGDVSGRRTAVGRPALLEAEGLSLQLRELLRRSSRVPVGSHRVSSFAFPETLGARAPSELPVFHPKLLRGRGCIHCAENIVFHQKVNIKFVKFIYLLIINLRCSIKQKHMKKNIMLR